MASAMPMLASVKGWPVGPITRAPASRQRAASGMSAVTTMSRSPTRSAIQSSAASGPSATTTRLISGPSRQAHEGVRHEMDDEPVPLGHAHGLVFHRAGIGVDVDGGGGQALS